MPDMQSPDIKNISALERLLSMKQLQIDSLLEVTQAINNNFSISALFRIYEFILRAQLGVQSLVVFIKNQHWECVCNTLEAQALKNIDIEGDLSEFKRITFLNADEHPNLNPFKVVIPVLHKSSPIAYILLGSFKMDDLDTTEEKLKFIQTITNIVIVAVENKKLFKSQVQQEVLKKELELAARMQNMLIPDRLPNHEYLEMSAVYLPNQDIGGDYYDVFPFNNHQTIFCVGDISGKGIAAALLMANFQATLKTLVTKELPLEELIEALNDSVAKITKGEKFITLFLGFYDAETRILTYVNAGHNPPLLYQNHSIIELESGSTLLGMFEDLPFIRSGMVSVEKEAVLISYTDGLIDFENESGEFFSFERLYHFLEDHHSLSMDQFNQQLMDYVNAFRGEVPFTDDVTLLSCRFH